MGVIYLDACLLIYLIERHARWGGPVADAMAHAGQARFGISPLVKCECLVGPIKRGDPAQHHRCEALWTNGDRLAQGSHGLARNILK